MSVKDITKLVLMTLFLLTMFYFSIHVVYYNAKARVGNTEAIKALVERANTQDELEDKILKYNDEVIKYNDNLVEGKKQLKR